MYFTVAVLESELLTEMTN